VTIDPPDSDGNPCAACKTREGVYLCTRNGEDVDLCEECAAEGTCGDCGEPVEPGHRLCAPCRDNDAVRVMADLALGEQREGW
jgi:hypothetical protein